MDKEGLRKQIYDELHSQFESKLRDAKKQKSQVEEELESSSEKWRAERRRLNAEIDRLENALADARDARRKTTDSKLGKTVDPQEIAKAQAVAEEKLKKATNEWENERSKLEAEISRLQQGVAELLERANNPLRAGQAARELLETKLEEALRMKRQAEDSLIAAKAEWDQEKLKMVGEMVKLRRSTGKTTKSGGDDDRVPELEKQLADAIQARERVNADLERASLERSKAKEVYESSLHRVTAQLEESRREAQDLTDRLSQTGNDSQKQVKDAIAARASVERELQRVSEELAVIKQTQASELRRGASQIDDAQSRTEQLQKQLTQATKERETLVAELENAKGELAELKYGQTDNVRKLNADLSDAQLKIQQLERRLEDNKGSVSKGQADHLQMQLEQVLMIRENLERDLQKTRQQVAELVGATAKAEQLQKDLTAATNARDALEQKLGAAQKETSQLIESHAASLRRVTTQLEEAQEKIQQLEQRLELSKGSAMEQAESNKHLADAVAAREVLAKELKASQEELAQAKEGQSGSLRRMMGELGDARTTIQILERRLEENKNVVSSDVVAQLRRQYDERMQDMIREKTQLSEELKNASSLLEAERSRFATAAAASAQSSSKQDSSKKEKGAKGDATVDVETLNAELARVEGMIKTLAKLIDDPATELSTVIRKNVERAELDAYLKGILFSIGRSQGM